MQTVVFRSRLREGALDDYLDRHRRVPEELAVDLRRAGVAEWGIWHDGLDLVNVLVVDDRGVMRERMTRSPANQEWQTRMRPLFAAHGGSGDLPLVWRLTGQAGE